MPILLFVFALTVVDLAIYGLFYSAHAMLIKDFAILEAAQVGGMQIAGRLMYFQFLLQFAATAFAFKVICSPRYMVAILCALIAFLVSAIIFINASLFSLWRLFTPNPFQWDMAEGFVLVLSVTTAWLVTGAIRPRKGQVIVASE